MHGGSMDDHQLSVKEMDITLIAAVAENNAIGKGNKMLWHLPDDFRYFRRNTLGHSVVMGRKTFESIGKPLPERRNIVLSRRADWVAEGVDVANSVDDVLAYCRDERDVFVIGGADLYRQMLPLAQRILLTRVHARPDGDAFFPEIHEAEWALTQQEQHPRDEKHALDFTFELWEKR